MPRRGQPAKILTNPVTVLIYVERDTRIRARKLDLNMSEICRDALIGAVEKAEIVDDLVKTGRHLPTYHRLNPYY